MVANLADAKVVMGEQEREIATLRSEIDRYRAFLKRGLRLLEDGIDMTEWYEDLETLIGE